MANPFEKRATEYLRDDTSFLSVVTPEPLYTFFENHAKDDTLYDRLCIVIGTPGSGKTTIATLLQFKTVETLRSSPNIQEHKALMLALSKCGIIKDGKTEILGCRLPLESEYREFWELPYKDDIKTSLLKSFLQSRAVIAWMKNLEANSRYSLDNIKVVYRDGSEAASEIIGGESAMNVYEKAKTVERSIYEIGAALIPPSEKSLKDKAISPYHSFGAIDHFSINTPGSNDYKKLKPLIMLDDAHNLHPEQLIGVVNWLAKREMKIGRWLLMRLDAQTPDAVLIDSFGSQTSITKEIGINKSREITYIGLQSSDDRRRQRENFRKMAKSMADKYLRLIPIFSRQSITRFSDLLNTNVQELSNSKIKDLEKKINTIQKKSGISSKRRESMEEAISKYYENSDTIDKGRGAHLAMLYIMLNRYIKRVPQKSLFSQDDDEYGPDPSKPLKATSGLADGAKIFLMHNYKHPYYYGIDALCDGSSENAELFLQLAGILVEAAETRIIRSPNTSAALPPLYQHKLLKERANQIIDEWTFPWHQEVRKLCIHIAKQCVDKSLEPNAPLDGGANAFGIRQEEFETIPDKHNILAKTLKFGIAYNAISLKHKYITKNKEWCLIELAGPVLMSHGLTMNRGGFLERNVSDLLTALEGS